ncbi:serine/threonine-protein kinase [Trujillonella endophytica]|uniref:non-specific serine/threonine protein kinase n=1 Tax=Trujillonella endophytica TaxID=673521 RepID=A0A1H8W2D8_9ACTN|nr:serine/threonine-protein kinase [Trujillella endophytica]SEP21802.1 Serine/threonine protein kinase [Trujillella endophytica]
MQVIGPGHLVSGRYRLLAQIAGGGMGTVWRARDELLGRQVAVKQILPPPGADEEVVDQQRQRALREGRIAARLSHPHAISVYDVATDGGQPWLVMEYLPSRSLAQVLFDDGPLPPELVAQIGAQVADALTATHVAGIVHRDVKPANVLVGQGEDVEGLVKITDFGISHAIGDVTLTQTGQITGTPAFLAPEVAQGTEMSEASDVFSLGATLYTCLEGEPPFGMDDNALRLLHRVAGGGVRPPARAGSLAAPLMEMLADDPAARPTMSQVRDRLAVLAAGRDGDPTTVLLARTELRPAPDRMRTASLPAGDRRADVVPPAAGPATPPAAAPTPLPPRPPAPVPVAAPAGTPAGRRRWPLVVAGLVLLLLIGGGVAWLVSTGGDGDGETADPAASSSSAPATTDSPEQSREPAPTSATGEEPAPSEETTPTTATSTPPGDPAAEVQQTLERYYDLLPDDTETAYELTGPSLRAQVGYGSYAGFFGTWSEVRLVDVRNVSVEGDRITATTDVEFVRPGEQVVETHAVTLVRDGDGGLLVDLDVLA